MPTFDETKYQLGTLCKRGRDFEDTGQTLRTWNGSNGRSPMISTLTVDDLAVTHDFGWPAQYEIPCPICEDLYFAIGKPQRIYPREGPRMQIPVSSECKHAAWLLNLRHQKNRTYFEIPVTYLRKRGLL